MGSSSHPQPGVSAELVPLRPRPVQLRSPSAPAATRSTPGGCGHAHSSYPGRVWWVGANGDVVCASAPPPSGTLEQIPHAVAWRSWARFRYSGTAIGQEPPVHGPRRQRQAAGFGVALSTLVVGIGLAAAAFQGPEPSNAASGVGDGARAGIPSGIPTMEFVYPSAEPGPQLLPQPVYPASVDPGTVDPGVVDPGPVDPPVEQSPVDPGVVDQATRDPGTAGTGNGSGGSGDTNNADTNNADTTDPGTTDPGPSSGSGTTSPTTTTTPPPAPSTTAPPQPFAVAVLNGSLERLVPVDATTPDGLPTSPEPSGIGLWTHPAAAPERCVLVVGPDHPAAALAVPPQEPRPPVSLFLFPDCFGHYVLGEPDVLSRAEAVALLQKTPLENTDAPVVFLLAATASEVTVVEAVEGP